MDASNTTMRNKRAEGTPSQTLTPWAVLVVTLLAGCDAVRPGAEGPAADGSVTQRAYVLRHLVPEDCDALLEPLDLDQVTHVSETGKNILLVKGAPDQLQKAEAILSVADGPEDYCIETLGPVARARTLPSNDQLAAALEGIYIGTFSEPGTSVTGPRAIVDIQGDAVLAFLPVRCRDRLRTLLASGVSEQSQQPGMIRDGRFPGTRVDVIPPRPTLGGGNAGAERSATSPAGDARPDETSVLPASAMEQPMTVVALTEMGGPPESGAEDERAGTSSPEAQDGNEPPTTVRITFRPASQDPNDVGTPTGAARAVPENGEDVLDMALPETITLVQLLDLAGEHLGLDYVYDPRTISNQSVALKLRGALRGEMKVKNLYTLLETVLSSMSLAMVRLEGDLVNIVPADKALETDVKLFDTEGGPMTVGNTIVTRVFTIRHVNTGDVVNLLQNMKLSVAATPLEGANLLIVTCHADRMPRVEQLVDMIDRPKTELECRFRRLRHVSAAPLMTKVRDLAQELRGIAVAAASTAAATPSPVPKPGLPAASRPAEAPAKRSVYLDTDDRTNRILMIGSREELDTIEELVDTLDVAQDDLRSPRIHTVKHLDAKRALETLQTLEVLKAALPAAAPGPGARPSDPVPTQEPLVAVLEATNQLLVTATSDQHARVSTFLHYIDVAPADTRTIAAYELRHIQAADAKQILEQLDVISADAIASSFIAGPNQPAFLPRSRAPTPKTGGASSFASQVVVNESTNALLVKAPADQQARIATILKYVDAKRPETELVYHVYPVESSSPDHLSSLLERLVQEKEKDKADKIEPIPATQDRITIVPDPNTFSLIVHASQTNQKWIEALISRLDKRRPQVLIDVTLVEVTRTDTFEYDLNLAARVNGAVVGNIVVDPIQTIDRGSRLEGGFNLLDQDGNPTGQTKAFYSDENVQALLTAIRRKNYGRVLAKPRVLVDDGREGQIVTTDATTYVKESIQIPEQGPPITTREFVPIEASIELRITPHISEGNLLRLDVYMSRDDFGNRPASGAPPDKATSEVTTTVFVPDDRTIILGGLVKLNQSKGRSKVPLLGDLPLVGLLFRSIDNSDIEKKLYVFLKANIVRPYDELGLTDLEQVSQEHAEAFERSESDFQNLEDIPGIEPEPMQPEQVLRDYK